MDERVEIESISSPWKEIDVLDEDNLYRQVPVFQRKTTRGKKYPSEAHFMLREKEDSLSLNIERYIQSARNNLKLISLVFNEKGEFLEYTSYKIFKFPVSFIKSLFKFNKLSYCPVYFGVPSPVGTPNNKSHMLLYCDSFDDISSPMGF